MVHAETTDDGGVRRRHSGPAEDSDGEVSNTHDGVHTGTRTISLDSARPSEDHARSVRFSEDIARRPRLKKRKSDEMSEDPKEPARSHGLSIDTSIAQAGRQNSLIGGNIVKSPTNITSPTSPPYEEMSTRSRNRGHSMRSSLFMRNMSQRQSSGIEMQNVGSSGSAVTGIVSTSQRTKKGSHTSVTIASVDDRSSTPPPFTQKPTLGSQGTSALPHYQQWVAKHARNNLPLKRVRNVYKKVQKAVLRIQEIPPSKDGRHILFDPTRKDYLIDERTGKPYVSNLIKSSKYNAWNFLPRQLYSQFAKFANFYFLCISILQMIPGLSTTGTYTTIIPLVFFVALSMAKEGYEDLRRHRLDKTENNSQARVLHVYQPIEKNERNADATVQINGPIHWATVKWQTVQVGDIVKLERDEAAPADLLLLGSTGANNTAYIETMALDGETNLKPKQPNPDTIGVTTDEESLAGARLHIVAEDPNLDLYNFEGKLTADDRTSPLTNASVIYRGSILRNTPEAYGLVIYTGEECKIRMNANKNPRIKAPALQTSVNRIVLATAAFVLILSLFCCIAYQIWQNTTEEKAWYIEVAPVNFGPLLTSFIIMYNTLIPLSLYVSMEIIKISQMLLLNSDIDMYDHVSNTPFEARTSTINEELGQVGYIFSDKTGTLTENVMRFRKLSVAGTAWLHDNDLEQVEATNDALLQRKKSKGKRPVWKPKKSTSSSVAVGTAATDNGETLPRRSTSQWTSSAAPALRPAEQSTRELIKYIKRRPYTQFSVRAKMMILSMALCHTCLPERAAGASNDDEKISYQAASPDELALVEAAKDLGYLAYERDASTLTLKIHSDDAEAGAVYESYEVLDVIEFSSKRKRMSVVVRFPDGRICVLCKGADSVIMSRLRLAHVARQKLGDIEKRTNQRKSMEAQEALRRKSSVIERSGSIVSMPRTSNSLARRSVNTGRPSIGRLDPVRDEVENWLSLREHDVDSPRISSHFGPSRASSLHSHADGLHIDEFMASDEVRVIDRCLQDINDFATEGLRTLLYGHRFLGEEEYQHWKKVYHDASTSLVNRSDLIDKAGELIEQQLELGGATAIEDKLQSGVPETIDRLRRANIKMWMLTGDKRETAINIGQSCRLIKDYSSVTVLDHEAGDVEQNIAASIIDINRGGVAHAVVVIDGQTLSLLQSDKSLHTLFLDLALLADSVICCRASPSQKASLVHAIRTRIKRSVTLAIGDGANDIAMIQEAQVGIGITGKEGLQAARTSDYSIAQFRFLAKLLLVHGRWNYIRTCKYAVGTFWKEMLFYLTQAFFQRYNGYSGTSFYESWSLSMFNTLFTSLTIIFLGIFEQDLHASTLIAVPELYTKGQRYAGFNLKVYLAWMFTAASDAAIIFYTVWGLYGNAIFSSENTLYPLGTLSFTACILVITIKLQVLEQRYKSIMAAIAIFAMVGAWALWNLILSALYAKNFEYNVKGGLLHRWGDSGLWWLTLIVAVTSCLLFEIGLRAVKAAFWPTDEETFQTLEGDEAIRKRFEVAAAPWLHSTTGADERDRGGADEKQWQAKREEEVQDLLSKPRTLEEGLARIETEEQVVMVGRQRSDLSAMLSERFGAPQQERMSEV